MWGYQTVRDYHHGEVVLDTTLQVLSPTYTAKPLPPWENRKHAAKFLVQNVLKRRILAFDFAASAMCVADSASVLSDARGPHRSPLHPVGSGADGAVEARDCRRVERLPGQSTPRRNHTRAQTLSMQIDGWGQHADLLHLVSEWTSGCGPQGRDCCASALSPVAPLKPGNPAQKKARLASFPAPVALCLVGFLPLTPRLGLPGHA